MKNNFKKIALLFVMILLVSCSKSEDDKNLDTEGYTGYYNSKDVYNNDLLLKIVDDESSVSYYGSTNEFGIDVLASLYIDKSSGKRTIYKVNKAADTSIVYDFDKPDLGGVLFVKKNTEIIVQEFEFKEDNKTIKPTSFIASVSIGTNKLSQSKTQKNQDNSEIEKAVDKAINDTGAWLMTSGASEYIKKLNEFRQKQLEHLEEIKTKIDEYLKNKNNKNPEPIEKEINEDPDPDPNIDSVKPLEKIPFVDCNNVANGSAYLDSFCNKCVGGNTGLPSCAPVLDCNSIPDGTAYKDNCGICVGGNTGKEPCVDCTNSTLQVTTSSTFNSASAIAVGGQAPYSYLWSNGTTQLTATNLTAGDYTVTVSDALKCTKTVNVKVLAEDACSVMTSPVITSIDVECNSDNQVAILVSFTADGSGILLGSGYGTCEESATCYPTRLYFYYLANGYWSIASNGYNAKLKSGTVNKGVVEINLTYNGNCIPGKTAREAINLQYGTNYQWKVELMNKCNQRSNQMSF